MKEEENKMATNGEMLNKQDIADVLITIENEVQRGRRCIVNILSNSFNALYRIERKCSGKCEECILKWLDEPAVILPMKDEG
jgi:hypothetical protein